MKLTFLGVIVFTRSQAHKRLAHHAMTFETVPCFLPGYTFAYPFTLLSSTKISPPPVTVKLQIVLIFYFAQAQNCVSSRFCLFYPSLGLQVNIFLFPKKAYRLTALIQNELLHYGKNTEVLLFVLLCTKAHFYSLYSACLEVHE